MKKKRVTVIFLVVLTVLALIVCYIIARPFLGSIISAAVIAIVFFPVHAEIAKRIRQPSLAALFSVVLVFVIILVPAVLVGAAVVREAQELYDLLSVESSESGGWTAYLLNLIEKPKNWIGRYVDVSTVDFRELLRSGADKVRTPLLQGGGRIFGNVISFIVNFVITLFVLFFLFREGRQVRRRVAAVVPLTVEQTEKLFSEIQNAIIATVYGGLAVAIAQGTLTGIAFWVLGLPSPFVWGLLTGLLSLVPMVGSGAVWAPAAVILILSGHWGKGIAMLAFGGVISTVDNVVRPYVMSGKVRLHTLLLFFAVLGGIQAFGLLGLFIGPVALAVTSALLGMLRDEAREWQAGWREETRAPEA
jgi:predicted PurR-regulated permease PerM